LFKDWRPAHILEVETVKDKSLESSAHFTV